MDRCARSAHTELGVLAHVDAGKTTLTARLLLGVRNRVQAVVLAYESGVVRPGG